MCNYIIYIMSTYNTERHIPDYTQDIYERGQLYRAHFNYLNEIKDKSLVLSVLCSKSCSLFSRIRTFINIPLILSSGAMTILNSMNDTDSTSIKYANIVLNSCTVTILSLIGNFKLTERELTYRNTHLKMKRLYHRVDSILRVDTTKINSQIVGEITKEYLNIYEHLDYPIPEFVTKRYNNELIANNKTLPNNNIHNDTPIFNPNLTFADNLLNNKNLHNVVV